jgi:hypothetical protein
MGISYIVIVKELFPNYLRLNNFANAAGVTTYTSFWLARPKRDQVVFFYVLHLSGLWSRETKR